MFYINDITVEPPLILFTSVFLQLNIQTWTHADGLNYTSAHTIMHTHL